MLSRNSTEKLTAYLQAIISIGRYMAILAWQQFYYLSSSTNFKTIVYMVNRNIKFFSSQNTGAVSYAINKNQNETKTSRYFSLIF